MAGVLLLGVAIVVLVRSRAALPMLMLALLVAGIAWAGFRGKYPFGGLMRHQFLVFPFAILSAGKDRAHLVRR